MMATWRKIWRLTRTVVYLPLLMSLWHAPMPWLHSHGVAVAGHDLHHHLEHFHGNASHAASETSGWHWHFAWPCQIGGCVGCLPDESGHGSQQHFPDFDYGMTGPINAAGGKTVSLGAVGPGWRGLNFVSAADSVATLADSGAAVPQQISFEAGPQAHPAQSVRAAIQVYLL